MATDYLAITKHNITQLGLDTRSRRSQVTMYSDSTHFIFELLQNADDYGATEVSFDLQPDRLVFSHNGIPFSEANVKAITYFGRSTSAEDLVKTGRFGVGFKSVFAFTATPIIISGEEHFRIYDLYKMEAVDRPAGMDNKRTYITLPFNHDAYEPDYVEEHISAKDAYAKIAKRLSGLDKKTILFTRNIKTIHWSVRERSGYYRRKDEMHDGYRISSVADEVAGKTECFLVFQKDVVIKGEQYKPVEVAFYLNNKKQIKRGASVLYVLFATIQETHLQFLINGPFRTNPSRESIAYDDDFNLHLIGLVSDLWEAILETLKKEGMLTMQVLDVLPQEEDALPEFYHPIQERIYDLLRKQAFLPAADGTFVRAQEGVMGPKAIRQVFSNEDISFFLKKDCKWFQGVSATSRAGRLLQALEVPRWSWDELEDTLETWFQDRGRYWYYGEDNKERFERAMAWLSTKSDSWLQQFYILLGTGEEKGHFGNFGDMPWKNEEGLLFKDSHLIKQAYHGEITFGPIAKSRFPKAGYKRCVHPAILSHENDEVAKQVYHSLKRIGVKEVDAQDEIKSILEERYTDAKKLAKWGRSREEHLQDMARFIRFSKEKNTVEPFKKHRIFLRDDSDRMYRGEHIFMDAPLLHTGLNELYEKEIKGIEVRFLLWSGYQELMEQGMLNFARKLGVQTGFIIEQARVYYNPYKEQLKKTQSSSRVTETGINEDYFIPSLSTLLALKNSRLNALLWNNLREVDPQVFVAKYRPNQQHATNQAPSTLAHTLKTTAWIPDQNGQFFKPGEITMERLHPDFIYDNRSGWLDHLDFGKVDEFDEVGQIVAGALGVESPTELNEWVSMVNFFRKNKITAEQVKVQFGMTKMPERPTAPIRDRKQTKQKTRKEYRGRPEKNYQATERKVRISKDLEERKQFLKEQYTNAQGQMVCQLCHTEMPFKYRGEYYFEAVEALDPRYLPREFYKQYLALCPNCAARFKLFIKQEDRKLEDLKYAIEELILAEHPDDIEDDLEITLQLDQEETLYFTEHHLTVLKAILEKDEEF